MLQRFAFVSVAAIIKSAAVNWVEHIAKITQGSMKIWEYIPTYK